MTMNHISLIVVRFSFHCAVCRSAKEGIHSCLDWYDDQRDITSKPHANVTLIQELSNLELEGSKFHLYKSKQPLNWCESLAYCEKHGERLAVGSEKRSQELWGNLTCENKSNCTFWVAARQKDFGSNWTWLSDDIAPFGASPSVESVCVEKNPDNPYCRVTLIGGTSLFENNAGFLKYAICASLGEETRIPQSQTWYEAMNACAEREPPSRLAVHDEIVRFRMNGQLSSLKTKSYWIGLYNKPWIWVIAAGNQNVTFRPVYYSSWANASDPQKATGCLAINGNRGGRWVAMVCTERLDYFLCESNGIITSTDKDTFTRDFYTLDATDAMVQESTETHSKTVITVPWSAIPVVDQYSWWFFVIGGTTGVIVSFSGIVIVIVTCVKKCKKSPTSGSVIIDHATGGNPQFGTHDPPYYSQVDSGYTYIRQSKLVQDDRLITPEPPPLRLSTAVPATDVATVELVTRRDNRGREYLMLLDSEVGTPSYYCKVTDTDDSGSGIIETKQIGELSENKTHEDKETVQDRNDTCSSDGKGNTQHKADGGMLFVEAENETTPMRKSNQEEGQAGVQSE